MAAFTFDALDHIVLTVRNIDATCAFYRDAPGMEEISFGQERRALRFGAQKINLRQAGAEFEPKAARATLGSADLCFITRTPLELVTAHLAALGVTLELGLVMRSGALGEVRSVYLRDPDGNLIEVSNYLAG